MALQAKMPAAAEAGRAHGQEGMLLIDLVDSIAGFGFCGFDLEPVLLSGGGEEAPDTVGLPVSRLLDLGEGGSLGPSDQVQDFRAFAFRARGAGLFGLGGFGRLSCRLPWVSHPWPFSGPWARPSSGWRPSSRGPSPARRARPVPQRRRLCWFPRWSYWLSLSFFCAWLAHDDSSLWSA